jgi:hypothetical protein
MSLVPSVEPSSTKIISLGILTAHTRCTTSSIVRSSLYTGIRTDNFNVNVLSELRDTLMFESALQKIKPNHHIITGKHRTCEWREAKFRVRTVSIERIPGLKDRSST